MKRRRHAAAGRLAWLKRLRWPRTRRLPAGAVSVRSISYSSSPLLASKTPPWRSRLLVALMGLGFCVLVGRAVYVQIIGTDFYRQEGEKRYAHTMQSPASRGRIVDRNGQLLAISVAAPSIWAIPREFDADRKQGEQLARRLGMSAVELEKRMNENPKFVWLRRQVDDPMWERVKSLQLAGVGQTREYKRSYPEGEAAAHVVGFTGADQMGQEGVELAFQSELQGRNGSREVVRDRFGRVVEDIGEQVDPVDGHDIELSIDSKVQFFAYQRVRDAVAEHKAKAGSVVVLDVKTGEVLALANYPSFNPNQRLNLSGEQLRNRALTDTFEPGSTMKPFIAAWAIQSGRVTPSTQIQTAPGSMVVTGSTIRDAHSYGMLSVAEVIQKSSNVGAVKMAMQMPAREMWELFSNIGLGQRPQIDFPGAVTGRLRAWKTWRPIEQATMSYGYGLSASLFQLAHADTLFACDGEVIPLSMLKQNARRPGLRVLSPETARAVRDMLRMAAGPGGTAPKAQAIGYSVGGKTGTARKQEGKAYAANKYRAWFVGLAPVSNPRIVVAVMVDEPNNGKYFGGEVAAPVFSQVVQQTLRMLGVAPDIEVKPQIVTNEVPAVEESF
jgi:cell division protein FtsI (penicillin-binding protein 3)